MENLVFGRVLSADETCLACVGVGVIIWFYIPSMVATSAG